MLSLSVKKEKKRKDPIRLLSTSFNDKLPTTNTAEIQVQRMCFLYYDYEGLNLVVPQKKEKEKKGGGVVDSHIYYVLIPPTPAKKKGFHIQTVVLNIVRNLH